ncbi:MAG: hypothetical protein WC375_02975 [Methanomassiliicoccales archaeon]|jgi:hypothetical protein
MGNGLKRKFFSNFNAVNKAILENFLRNLVETPGFGRFERLTSL